LSSSPRSVKADAALVLEENVVFPPLSFGSLPVSLAVLPAKKKLESGRRTQDNEAQDNNANEDKAEDETAAEE
jgi:hypothetical protein